MLRTLRSRRGPGRLSASRPYPHSSCLDGPSAFGELLAAPIVGVHSLVPAGNESTRRMRKPVGRQPIESRSMNSCDEVSRRLEGGRWSGGDSPHDRSLSGMSNDQPCPARRQNLKRVRPPGSAAKATIAERGSMRYTFHGGGPCDGALNGAVMPDPLSSGSAGHPLSAHALAIRATAPGSVTRAASPSITTSASRIDTAIEHRGSRATLRAFRVPAPVWNQNVSPNHRAPTAVTCGLPSSLTVDSQVVREFTASGAGADPAASFATTAAQSTGGSPSALPRLTMSIRYPSSVRGTSWLTASRT